MNTVNQVSSQLPTLSVCQQALSKEFMAINGCALAAYFESSRVSKEAHIESKIFIVYSYRDEDLDELIFMVAEFIYNHSKKSFEFVEMFEEGGFDTLEEAIYVLRDDKSVAQFA